LPTDLHTGTARDYAALALSFAVQALADAEKSECDNDEIVGLCNEVIARRLRLQMIDLAHAAKSPRRANAQMFRDRLLLNHSGG
jgi:hypothetical protein